VDLSNLRRTAKVTRTCNQKKETIARSGNNRWWAALIREVTQYTPFCKHRKNVARAAAPTSTRKDRIFAQSSCLNRLRKITTRPVLWLCVKFLFFPPISA